MRRRCAAGRQYERWFEEIIGFGDGLVLGKASSIPQSSNLSGHRYPIRAFAVGARVCGFCRWVVATSGKSEFGFYGGVGGMMVGVLLAIAIRLVRVFPEAAGRGEKRGWGRNCCGLRLSTLCRCRQA